MLSKLREAWYKFSELPAGWFSPRGPRISERPGGGIVYPSDTGIHCAEDALSLSPFFAALRLFQTTVGSLPLVTYRKTEKGRERAESDPAYSLLHERPNPAMSRATFFALLVKEHFIQGESFTLIRWKGNGKIHSLIPIPAAAVQRVEVDGNYQKTYYVNTAAGPKVYSTTDIIHTVHFSHDGIRGVPFLEYAAQSLGLHKQVQDSAQAYYENAARPSVYGRIEEKMGAKAVAEMADTFNEKYGGTKNRGRIPFFSMTDLRPFPSTTADDAQIIQALGLGVPEIARWFLLSALTLGDLTRGTYSNLAADNTIIYQRSMRPVFDVFELEFNNGIFGPDGKVYCEFLVEALLRGDPLQQCQVWHSLIADGVITRAEVRAQLNLDHIDGLDLPLMPLNMGPPELGPKPETPADNPATPNPENNGQQGNNNPVDPNADPA